MSARICVYTLLYIVKSNQNRSYLTNLGLSILSAFEFIYIYNYAYTRMRTHVCECVFKYVHTSIIIAYNKYLVLNIRENEYTVFGSRTFIYIGLITMDNNYNKSRVQSKHYSNIAVN